MTAYKIGIVGPQDIISGFQSLGVVPFVANNGDDALNALKKIKKDVDNPEIKEDTFASVILIESIAKEIPEDELEKISRGALPALLIIPGIEGSDGSGVAKLKRLAERAVGSDILG